MNAIGRLGLTLMVTTLVACAQAPGASPTPSPVPTPTPTTNPSPDGSVPAGLAGRQFLSTGVTQAGAPFALVPNTRIRLTFDATGGLSANAGCNIIGGSYVLDGNRIVWTGGGMTEMGCDQPRHAQDNWLASFLGSGATFALNGNDLTLTVDDTVITLLDREIAEPDQPLVGPMWVLSGFIDGDVASSIPQGVTASLVFAADGSFSMDDGCNSGGGSYVVDGDAIRFLDIVTTKMACGSAPGQVEQAVLFILRSESIAFAVDASSLTLTAGTAGLQFIATEQ